MYTKINNKFLTSLCVAALMMVSLPVFADMRTYEVKPGDTLYRISHLFNVTQQALQNANPGVIDGTNVPAGAVINIPDPEDEPSSLTAVDSTDQRVEQMSVPVAPVALVTPAASVAERVGQWFGGLFSSSESQSDVKTIAFILPFNLASHSTAEDKVQMRSVEFYQGALLAVNRAQLNGMHVRLLTYDLGTETLPQILAHEELLGADLIVTPMESAEIREVALFAEKNGINVINPFKLVPELTNSCTHLFQLNTYIAELYPELTTELKHRFDDHAFVFVSDSLFLDKSDPYADYLKKDLKASGIPYYEYIYGSPESVTVMDEVLNLKDSNILFVPETNQRDALRRFFPSLKNKIFLEAHPEVAVAALMETDPEAAEKLEKEIQERKKLMNDSNYVPRKMAILGYPEWQLYTQDFMDHFFDMNVWMFSKFYIDPFDADVIDVQAKYRYWYAREMHDLYPKYAMLGYDVASYGLLMLANYGHDFDRQADGKYIKTLQSAMLFKRIGEGGFVNKGLYLVHFTPESTIERFEIK